LVPTSNSETLESDMVEVEDTQLSLQAYWLISSDLSFGDCMLQREKIPSSLIHYSRSKFYFYTNVWFPVLNTIASSLIHHLEKYQRKFQLNSSMLYQNLVYQNVQSNMVLTHKDSMGCRLCVQKHPSYIVCRVMYTQLLSTIFFLLFQEAHRDTDCASRRIAQCFLKSRDTTPLWV
jgi:hypothetical protein